jgi:hypothetical protein
MFKKIVDWSAFAFYMAGLLLIISALWLNSFYVTKWLNENRPGATLPTITLWLFKNGSSPYIGMSLVLAAVALICKAFDRYFPFLYLLITLGLECMFIAIYIVAISFIKSHWGSLVNPN